MLLLSIKNIRIITQFLLISLLFQITGFGQNDHFAAGNIAFEKELYQQALDEYKKLENNKLGGFGLYANIARSYAQLKKDPQAILYYEKALKIKPNNREIKHELSAIKKRNPELDELSTDFFLVNWWNSISGILMPDTWAILSLIILAFMGFLFVFGSNKLIIRHIKHKYLFLAAFALFITCILAANRRYNKIYNNDQWIVIAPETKLKTGPDDLSPDISPLPAGTKIKKRDMLGQWIQVISPYGDTGWIKVQSAASI